MFKRTEKIVGFIFIITSLILSVLILNKLELIHSLFIEYIANFPTFCLSVVLFVCGILLIRGDK